VLTALGVKVATSQAVERKCLDEAGLCFMFAPAHHPSLKHVMGVRSELGFRTVFNLLGPLTNPAGAKRQVVGVPLSRFVDPMARALGALGSERAWTVHGDGMDELSTTGETEVAEWKDGGIRLFTIWPEALGLKRVSLNTLVGGTPDANAIAMRRMLDGEQGPYREIVLMNTAAALLVADKVETLRDGVEAQIDFAAVRACESLQLFIAATNVHTGKVRVFERSELTVDMLMASAALPTIFKAVEIDGVPYWDGGYMGNPVLFPFFSGTRTEDIILVQINPLVRDNTPDTTGEILERVNEITFNAALLHELRAIDFVRRLIDAGRLDATHYKRVRLHRVEAQKELNAFGATSKMQADWGFFEKLHAIGYKAGEAFLAAHFDEIGREGTLDLKAELA
jgi:predicted acylesterase/phospholipase RssA